MSGMSLTLLHQALRRAFQSVQRNQRTWLALLQDCGPLVLSLGNVGEQFVALSKVDLSRTPLRGLPGLEPKLRFKLHHAADTVMGKLQEKLLALQSVRDAVSSQVASVFQILEQIQDQVSVSEQVSALTERSAGAPSVADMLVWLQDADQHYRQQFIKRKTLLLTLRPEGFSQMESAPEKWRSLSSVKTEDRINGVTFRTMVHCCFRNVVESVLLPGAAVTTIWTRTKFIDPEADVKELSKVMQGSPGTYRNDRHFAREESKRERGESERAERERLILH